MIIACGCGDYDEISEYPNARDTGEIMVYHLNCLVNAVNGNKGASPATVITPRDSL